MRNGGYTILNLSDVTLTASGGSYVGNIALKTYNAIQNSGKPVYVSGLKIGSTVYGDSLATITYRNPSNVIVCYLVTSGFIQITITNEGAVTIVVND